MSARFAALLAWLLFVVPHEVRADGKVFSQVTAVRTVTPDQRALLHFANGTETLVVETSFVGAGTNFAWVVPLPAAPEISAVPGTAFTNLERLFQPEVIHQQTKWWIGMAILVVLGGILRRWSHVQVNLVPALLCLVGCLLLPTLFLPSLAKARAGGGISIEPTGVQVLARQTVGVFDTVTLRSPDGAALTRWLSENGFALPAAAAPVIADYAKQGWVFAAAKLSRPDATGKTSPHPLTFKFPTDRAVYPLRLTGVENDRCLVELYVFGKSRAELPGFKVEQCLNTEFPPVLSTGTNHNFSAEITLFQQPKPGQLRIRHPALRSLVAGATVGPKLTATLDAAGMSRDAFVDWVPFEQRLASAYSFEAATARALNLGVAALLLALPCVGFWLWRRDGKWTFPLLAKVGGGVAVVSLAYFLALPKIEVEVRRGWQFSPSIQHSRFLRLGWELRESQEYLECSHPRPEKWNLKRLRAELAPNPEFPRSYDVLRLNLFTGEPLREAATPGNLLFRPTERGTEVLWHDVDCVEHLLSTLPTRAP